MEMTTILEEPDRATAAPYWDATGLTGVELGPQKMVVMVGGSWRNSGTQDSLDALSLWVSGQRGSWVTAAFSAPHWATSRAMGDASPTCLTTVFAFFFFLPRGTFWLCLVRFYLDLELLLRVNISCGAKRVTCQIKTCRHKCWIPDFCLCASKQDDALAQSWRSIVCQIVVKTLVNPKENIRHCAQSYTLSLWNILTRSPLKTHHRTFVLSFSCILFF